MTTNYNGLQITIDYNDYNFVQWNSYQFQWTTMTMTSISMDYNYIQYCKSTNDNDFNYNGQQWIDGLLT